MESEHDYLVMASALVETVGLQGYELVATVPGGVLAGLQYEPLYNPHDFGVARLNMPAFEAQEELDVLTYRAIAADFVSLDDGTGIVHVAPAFGIDDMELGKKNHLPVLLNIDEEGRFRLNVKKWAGMYFKEADPLIIEDLRQSNLLFKEEPHEHDYPFCWRCHTPLLYYAKKSWFIRMKKVKRELIRNNKKINWIPSYLKEVCKFLEGKEIDAPAVTDACKIAESEISPISDVRGSSEYKRLLLRQLIFTHFIKLFPNRINIGMIA